MRPFIHALWIFICVLALAGCSATTDSSQNIEPTVSGSREISSSERTPVLPANSFEIEGTVRYKNIEGGFYAIDGDDGKKYDPINLPESFRKDGLKVKATVRLKKDATSFHMYGSIVDIVDIAAR